ncbi:MAG TPA: hypothetical protein PKN23_09875 [Candidatus Hydrogenedentes bacterium]|nr:hypothetical protein [Candidatus Hydrogenedentota bacterium]HOH49712.1 hypothetical protein [Candidatus Hydrogenedentota bacterium]
MRKNGMTRRGFLGAAAGSLAALSGRALSAESGKAEGGRVATFSCDMTPPLGTPWYPSYKGLDTIEQPLQGKGIVLEHGGERHVLCVVDWCELCNDDHRRFCEAIAAAAGTAPDRVAVHTVHQHTAPMADLKAFVMLKDVPSPPPVPTAEAFSGPLARLEAAVREACGRLEPYDRIGTGQAQAERVASNRRVPLGDGKVGFRASSCKEPALIEAPEGVIDPYVKTVTFARGDKPLARLHYYATHPQSFYWDPRSSIDFPGMAREALEREEGVFQAYFTGCGGNIAAGKYNDGTPEARQGLYERLLAAMRASAASTVYTPAGPVDWKTVPVALSPRVDAGFTGPELRARMLNPDGTPNDRICAAMVLAWQARAAEPLVFSRLRVGGVDIVHLPGEMAVEFQLLAQTLRPDAFVAVAAYGDCGPAYINPERFTAEGGYEPTASHVVPESEMAVRDALQSLLAG